MADLRIPSAQHIGAGSIGKLVDVIKSRDARNILVMTDKGIVKAGLCEGLIKVLDSLGVSYTVNADAVPEPSIYDAEKTVDAVSELAPDIVIGIGGGSVMDIAKLVTVLSGADYTVKDLLNNPSIAQKKIYSLMIPTTCGTGAEATGNSILAIPEEETKQGIVNPALVPDEVILDPELIRNLPKHIIASTGVDALAHCVECYTSNKATPLSNLYAREGARLIFSSIIRAYTDASDMEAKMNMMLGAFYGGVAIAGSGTTAVHALAYPLGGKYHIAHGVSNAILFAQVMEFNRDACVKELAELCDVINPELQAVSEEEKSKKVIERIAEIVKVTEIPVSLDRFGITKDDLEFLVTAGSQQKRLLVNNKKELSLDDIRAIYLSVL